MPLRHPAERAHRDRVVAAEHERHASLLGRVLDERGDVLARLLDLREVARGRVALVGCLGDRRDDVAPVGDVAAELADAGRQVGVADRRRAHVDAAAPGAEVEPDADDRDGLRAHVAHAARNASWASVGAVELDAERAQLGSRDQVVQLGGELLHARLEPAGGEPVDRERLHGEREVHDLDRVAVETGDVDERAVDERVDAPLAEPVGLHLRARVEDLVGGSGEGGHVDLAVVVARVREDRAVLQERQLGGADDLRQAGRRDHDVGVEQRVVEREDTMAVHVRGQRAHRVDLDDRDAAAEPVRRAGEPAADVAVADDAELAAGGEHVRQREDRGQRRLPGAVGVVEQVLALRVVRGDGGERQQTVRRERAEARDAGRRLLADTGELLEQIRPVLGHPPRQLGPVVDHELSAGLGDREQVGGELFGRRTMPRVHLDALACERSADRVLRREWVRTGGNDLGAGGTQREHEARGLRLEVDDDGHLAACERPVSEPALRAPRRTGMCSCAHAMR